MWVDHKPVDSGYMPTNKLNFILTAPSWPDSSTGRYRAIHQQRRGHGSSPVQA